MNDSKGRLFHPNLIQNFCMINGISDFEDSTRHPVAEPIRIDSRLLEFLQWERRAPLQSEESESSPSAGHNVDDQEEGSGNSRDFATLAELQDRAKKGQEERRKKEEEIIILKEKRNEREEELNRREEQQAVREKELREEEEPAKVFKKKRTARVIEIENDEEESRSPIKGGSPWPALDERFPPLATECSVLGQEDVGITYQYGTNEGVIRGQIPTIDLTMDAPDSLQRDLERKRMANSMFEHTIDTSGLSTSQVQEAYDNWVSTMEGDHGEIVEKETHESDEPRSDLPQSFTTSQDIHLPAMSLAPSPSWLKDLPFLNVYRESMKGKGPADDIISGSRLSASQVQHQDTPDLPVENQESEMPRDQQSLDAGGGKQPSATHFEEVTSAAGPGDANEPSAEPTLAMLVIPGTGRAPSPPPHTDDPPPTNADLREEIQGLRQEVQQLRQQIDSQTELLNDFATAGNHMGAQIAYLVQVIADVFRRSPGP